MFVEIYSELGHLMMKKRIFGGDIHHATLVANEVCTLIKKSSVQFKIRVRGSIMATGVAFRTI